MGEETETQRLGASTHMLSRGLCDLNCILGHCLPYTGEGSVQDPECKESAKCPLPPENQTVWVLSEGQIRSRTTLDVSCSLLGTGSRNAPFQG